MPKFQNLTLVLAAAVLQASPAAHAAGFEQVLERHGAYYVAGNVPLRPGHGADGAGSYGNPEQVTRDLRAGADRVRGKGWVGSVSSGGSTFSIRPGFFSVPKRVEFHGELEVGSGRLLVYVDHDAGDLDGYRTVRALVPYDVTSEELAAFLAGEVGALDLGDLAWSSRPDGGAGAPGRLLGQVALPDIALD